MLVLWWSSSRTVNDTGETTVGCFLHNGGHVVAFGVLGALALLALDEPAQWRRRHAVAALLIALLYGIVDEVHQRWVPGRTSSIADVLSDGAGAMLAACLLLGFATDVPAARRLAIVAALLAVATVSLATWTSW